MPSQASRAPPLKVGDKVSMAVSHFGEECVRGRASCLWALDEVRDDAVVVEEQDGKYLIKSGDDTETHFVREELQLFELSADAAPAAAPAPLVLENNKCEGEIRR